jgi:hypothetical protein
MGLFDTKPQYNMAGGKTQPQGGGFDYQSLLGNPMLHAGIGLLGSQKGQGAQAALQGAMQGMQYKQQFAAQDKKKAEEERLAALSASLPGMYERDGIGGVGSALLGDPSTMGAGASLLGSAANTQAGMQGIQGSPFKLGSGNMGYLTKTGEIIDTQTPFHSAPVTFGAGGVQYDLDPITRQAKPIVDPSTVASTAGSISASQSGQSEAAKQSIQLSGKAFEQLRPVGESIALLDQADAQLAGGASTGPVMDMLPSISSASLALDNTQKQLGLNVIQNTTFGALSEKEMKLAMLTGLPTGMKPEDLRVWVQDKRAAQVKLKNYLEEAATYLGTPGNTVAKFMAEKKAAAGGSSSTSSGVDMSAIRAEKARRQQARGQ